MNKDEMRIGQVLDRRYQMVRIIGSGGMSVVYEAVDLVNNRTVAVKILKDEMASDLQAVKRFINESKAVSLLNHPGIVRIYDVVITKELKYIVMERVQGITLKRYIEKKGALSMQEILSYSEQILRALAHAHSKGIIHRDIKPQNILLLKSGRIKVADFGIAKLPGSDGVTMTDKAIGTVSYISPEQASGKPIDPRSDLYSLGVCMYEMATGTLPFLGESPVSVALMQVNDRPRPPREIIPSLPFGLEQIILGAMEKDPNRRFQDATQMLRHISQLRTDPAFVFRTHHVRRSDAERHLLPPGTPEGEEHLAKRPIRKILNPKAVKKKPVKKKKKQSSSMFPIIAGVALAFFMVAIVCAYLLLSAFLEMQEKLQPVTVTVPSLVGKTYSAPLLEGYDPTLFTFQLEYQQNDDYPENTILEQDPSAGSSRKVKPGETKCTITITISCEEGSITLPDLRYSDHRVAEQKIKTMGGKMVTHKEYNSNIDSGMVIRTEPEPGTPIKNGDTVTVYVSQGPKIEMTRVPNFVGSSTFDAWLAMEEGALLSVGHLTYDYSDEYESGLIIGQSVLNGSSVVKGTSIDFVISLGPKTVLYPVPKFIGMSFTEALLAMSDEEGNPIFTLGEVTYIQSEIIAPGTVIDQSILWDEMVEAGCVIHLTVSEGSFVGPLLPPEISGDETDTQADQTEPLPVEP